MPKTLIGLEKWLQELWQVKEERLEKFFESKLLSFSANQTRRPEKTFALQYVSLFAWFSFMYWSISTLTLAKIAWIVLVSSVMALVSKYTNGLQEMEAKLDNGTLTKSFMESISRIFRRNQDSSQNENHEKME